MWCELLEVGAIELIACEVEVKVSACVISCLSFAWNCVCECGCRIGSRKGLTSHARVMREDTVREGSFRLFWAQMSFILSTTCCRVGARVLACR